MTDLQPLDICVDAYPPGQRFQPAARPDPVDLRSTSRKELALAKYKLWQEGQILRVSFMTKSLTDELREAIQTYASEWLEYANLKFEFGNFPDAEIRVRTVGNGYWSCVGTDAMQVPSVQATMMLGGPSGNLAHVSDPADVRRIVLHEFGHAIGCVHEQARPNSPIPWNKPRVYDYYREFHGWDAATVDANIFERYEPSELHESETYDTRSIMQYAVDRDHTVGGYEIPWNMTLSETDKKFIASMYP